jgi:ParB family transcriptional regulator, chromosome partitioning protein
MAKGLGRGFDTLIPQNFDSSLLIDAKDRVQKLLITDIQPNPEQPRRHFDEGALKELALSITRYGVLQPLIVSPTETGKYIIVAGERRWRASQIAGLTHVPTIVRKQQELENLEIALIENVQRVDLSPIEQAVSIEKLHSQFNMSYSEIAKRLGKATPTISNIVRLLELPENAREALQNEKISEGHARAILALKEMPEKQTELLESIQKYGWSVRQAEQFVISNKQGADKNVTAKRVVTQTPETKRLGKHLGAPVSIKRTAKGGKLEISFQSDTQLQELIDRLLQG